MDPALLKYLLLGIITLNLIFEKSINWLNVRRAHCLVPKTLEQYLSQEKVTESEEYQKTNYNFGLITGLFTYLITAIFILFGFFGDLDIWLQDFVGEPLLRSLIYIGILFIGSDLLSLPFDYYHTFKIEEKFGFNKTTPKTFFLDKLKSYLLSITVGGVLLLALFWLIHQIGSDFWWIFWAVAMVFMLAVNLFYTAWVLPIFNKLSPLEEGELKNRILAYANSVGFSLDNIFVVDGSKRSTKANAFFSGFGRRKKVVLFDTLIEQHTPDELIAVLAHEIGHYKRKHIWYNLLTSSLQVGVMLYILSLVIYNENMSLALGGNQLAIHLNLIGFTMLFSPISMLLGVGLNMMSRKHEYEADAFAKETFAGQPLAEALKTLSVKTLSHLNPHPLYVFVHYSHPPLLKRLAKLEG
ncbi:M48 family metallopeptidase [Litoribacter alkaliphilus]|uniref:M48 family metallopeptidase n=1 Tax=Litoribacter ruber TaxID=702568 RepID=A0AAP2G130_9BACT|nr:M48 family metallopeptidase [Litoribacter alkaliphilus]MBS9523939.1 M48 family metallopeptidase [Litoribacter alkaliphilus]